MIFYTKETATCHLTVKNEIDDELLTEKEKKIIKKIVSRANNNGGTISKEDSDLFYEIERRVSSAGGVNYSFDEEIDEIVDYEFDEYGYFDIDF